ncbi:RnfH family protein [Alteromonas sediminis]|uniref:UPF0125 protein DRW07_04840 n=1 Tax=Alteromonas sediminis TaxID=2259342 RepID=A0A3N5Y613_9ALTE|nr:RnfH family protein [Alteromonas sediminis]RPJ68723.1 RnfH family protein [Alteromonas sediminis]
MSAEVISVEVAYALPHSQTLLEIVVHQGTTVEQAVVLSNITSSYPELDLSNVKYGIWSRVVKPNTVLKDGDRVEIYRPLIADPKEVRKRRAEKAKEEGRADKVTGGRPSKLRAE